MYDHIQPVFGRFARSWIAGAMACAWAVAAAPMALAEEYSAASVDFTTPNIIRHISRESERLEMTANASRILTMDVNIPRVQVNNPELVSVTPLSATQIQVSAKKPGVTQINLWDQDNNLHSLDVIIYGDVKELEHALRAQFPNASVAVRKYSQSLMLTGFVDSPDHVGPIMRLAEDYAPKVINALDVGGVQQVLLKVKVFEVSRTKLRRLGVDWAAFGAGGDFAINSVSGLISNSFTAPVTEITQTGSTYAFGVTGANSSFFAFLDALQENQIAKILAEPNIVSVSGRPAQFLEGGEIPILVPQSLGTSSIEFKPFGTQVDFLPIVLGNGNIRLEVRPRVSAIDDSIGIVLQNQSIPGFRVRQADTAVEMRAGQTFALAGLIQRQTEAVNRGLPIVSDIPVLGIPFRKVEEEVNEIELLILVTPEFIDAMDPHEVPPCGPGMGSMSPNNCQLYSGGHLEVPNAYGPCGQGCQGGCNTGDGCMNGAVGVPGNYTTPVMPGEQIMTPEPMPYNESYESAPAEAPTHGELQMPNTGANVPAAGERVRRATRPGDLPGGYSTPRTANYRRAATPSVPPAVPSPTDHAENGGLIGPVGYDVE
ncbi:type II and III secretion system protein family protein [Aeoliella sp.]|uniref:type II and III secretion system protein family protein n=1 Tax=Aeoliella sp. TaxID=2795800 RepID=UPI003CCC2E84